MDFRLANWAFGMLFLVVGVAAAGGGSRRNCSFPAIFNFGDSNSDTGTSNAVFAELLYPNGISFHNITKRRSDGRLMIDFIAENLGLPYLDSPLDSIGTNFAHGANFAAGGTKISPNGTVWSSIPFHLDLQVSQFFQFKNRWIIHHNKQLNKSRSNIEHDEVKYPKPEDFSKALYTIDIGQNDNFTDAIPSIVNQFSHSLQRLLLLGANFVWIHNVGPRGCVPVAISACKKDPKCLFDKDGCMRQFNEEAREFNKQLKDRIYKLRAKYPLATITYFDMYAAKYDLITNAKKYGFGDPFKFCCGTVEAECSLSETTANGKHGKLIGTACKDPSKYISWDGTHYTQAANQFVAKLIVNGSLSDPPVPISEACHKP